jgi:hypothetical protein
VAKNEVPYESVLDRRTVVEIQEEGRNDYSPGILYLVDLTGALLPLSLRGVFSDCCGSQPSLTHLAQVQRHLGIASPFGNLLLGVRRLSLLMDVNRYAMLPRYTTGTAT